jgi:uncharacterized protein (TIGR00369 family)
MDLEQLRAMLAHCAVPPMARARYRRTHRRRELILEMPWRDEIVSNPMIGSAHGGIISTLIDLTGLYAINALGGSARATADMRVDFHRPATSGPLYARSAG